MWIRAARGGKTYSHHPTRSCLIVRLVSILCVSECWVLTVIVTNELIEVNFGVNEFTAHVAELGLQDGATDADVFAREMERHVGWMIRGVFEMKGWRRRMELDGWRNRGALAGPRGGFYT